VLREHWGLKRAPLPQRFIPGVLKLLDNDLTNLYEPTGRTVTLAAYLRPATQTGLFTRYASSQHVPGPIVLREAWWMSQALGTEQTLEISFGDWYTFAPDLNDFPDSRSTGHTARGINHYSQSATWGVTIKQKSTDPLGSADFARAFAIVELLRKRTGTP